MGTKPTDPTAPRLRANKKAPTPKRTSSGSGAPKAPKKAAPSRRSGGGRY